jgi:YesN/AraC family two-component response regulator
MIKSLENGFGNFSFVECIDYVKTQFAYNLKFRTLKAAFKIKLLY